MRACCFICRNKSLIARPLEVRELMAPKTYMRHVYISLQVIFSRGTDGLTIQLTVNLNWWQPRSTLGFSAASLVPADLSSLNTHTWSRRESVSPADYRCSARHFFQLVKCSFTLSLRFQHGSSIPPVQNKQKKLNTSVAFSLAWQLSLHLPTLYFNIGKVCVQLSSAGFVSCVVLHEW